MKNMSGKIALITGGSRGLGRDMAMRLSENGSDVILTYRSKKEEAEQVVSDIEAKGQQAAALPLDVGDLKSFDSFIESVKSLLKEKWNRDNFDFLINNAGIGIHATVAETTEEQFDQLLNIHFKGVYFLTQKAMPLLADSGRIINISSGLARFSFPGYAAYGSMKAAIEAFTRYLAKELGSRKITANSVAPGAIYTDFNKDRFDSNPQQVEMLSNLTPLGRVGQAEDIGGIVAFLCSEDGYWVNGQRIEASGGIFV